MVYEEQTTANLVCNNVCLATSNSVCICVTFALLLVASIALLSVRVVTPDLTYD